MFSEYVLFTGTYRVECLNLCEAASIIWLNLFLVYQKVNFAKRKINNSRGIIWSFGL